MKVGAQQLIDRAIELHAATGRPLPGSVAGLSEAIHALDAHTAMKLDRLLEAGDASVRVHYQRQLEARSAGAEAKRHAAAGSAIGQAGLYIPSELHKKVPAKRTVGPGFTPMNLSPTEKRLHEADLQARAELAKRAAKEGLTGEQQKAELEKISAQADEARLATKDVQAEARAKEAKIDALPWILRILVRQMQAWSSLGRAAKDGEVKVGPFTGALGGVLRDVYEKR